MSKDPKSDLMAVTQVLHDEMSQPDYPGKEAVLASCTLFLGVATRPAQQQQALKDRAIPEDDR